MSVGYWDLVSGLKLAVDMLSVHEPGDSRAVSDEFVALAALSIGDGGNEVMKIIHESNAERRL
jgi:hypothetical protein